MNYFDEIDGEEDFLIETLIELLKEQQSKGAKYVQVYCSTEQFASLLFYKSKP